MFHIPQDFSNQRRSAHQKNWQLKKKKLQSWRDKMSPYSSDREMQRSKLIYTF